MSKPLNNIRVLDLTNVLSGPFCTHHLVHMGAEVIKIEVPTIGDLARQLGADEDLNRQMMGTSFLAQNAGKKSITLNLKTDQGKSIFKTMVEQSDVVIENFRPGVMQRLGLDFEQLKTLNPKIIYCAISGFGQSGELKDAPAYDQIIQGLSGVMDITGEPHQRYRVGYPLCDTIGGLTAAFAICAYLANPQRKATFLDVSMLDSTLSTMGWVISNFLIAGLLPSANGNENITSAPSGVFQCQDAKINIAANKQQQFEDLCHFLQCDDLIEHQDYCSRSFRKQNRIKLKHALEAKLINLLANDVVKGLNKLGVPSGKILSVPEAIEQPQIDSRDLFNIFDNLPYLDKPLKLMRTGVKVNGESLKVDSPPPKLGQHQADIFASFGIHEDLQQLKNKGII